MGPRRLDFLLLLRRPFGLLVNIEPAQVLTFFCFLLDFLPALFDELSVVAVSSFPDIDNGRSVLETSQEFRLTGRDFDGEWVPENCSKPKKDHLFAIFVGLGSEEAVSGEGSGIPESRGKEPRRFGPARGAPSCGDDGVLSSTAPAVLGLNSDSTTCDAVGSSGAKDSSFSIMGVFEAERIEEMLPERE